MTFYFLSGQLQQFTATSAAKDGKETESEIHWVFRQVSFQKCFQELSRIWSVSVRDTLVVFHTISFNCNTGRFRAFDDAEVSTLQCSPWTKTGMSPRSARIHWFYWLHCGAETHASALKLTRSVIVMLRLECDCIFWFIEWHLIDKKEQCIMLCHTISSIATVRRCLYRSYRNPNQAEIAAEFPPPEPRPRTVLGTMPTKFVPGSYFFKTYQPHQIQFHDFHSYNGEWNRISLEKTKRKNFMR